MMLKEGAMLLLVRFLHIWQGNLWFDKSYLIHFIVEFYFFRGKIKRNSVWE